MGKEYKKDIAISFAAADRNIALCVYLALQLRLPKKEAYYYPEKQQEMVGNNLIDTLKKIYSEDSKYVILLVSEDYVDKNNKLVQTEINAYMPRFLEQKSTYLIPIIVDQTPVENVHEALKGITFFHWEYNPEELVKMIQEMLDGNTHAEGSIIEQSAVKISESNLKNSPTIVGNDTTINY